MTLKWSGGTAVTKHNRISHLLDTMLPKYLVNPLHVPLLHIRNDNALGGAHDHRPHVLLGDGAEGGLKAEAALVLDAAVVNMDAEEHLAVALVPPAHPVGVLPRLPHARTKGGGVLTRVRMLVLAQVSP